MAEIQIVRPVGTGLRAPPGVAGDVELLFQSRWDHGTGNQNDELMDGDGSSNWKWNEFFCSGRHDVLAVVVGSGLGWARSPNVFRVQHTGVDGECGAIQRREVVPASTSHWGRMYHYADKPGWDGEFHNFSYNFVGDIHLVFFRSNGRAEGWRAGLAPDYDDAGNSIPADMRTWTARTGPGNAPDLADLVGTSVTNPILLDHETWYRYEWMIEYLTATSYRIWPRVYSMADELLLDASNYYRIWNDSRTLEEFYGEGGAFGMSSVELMRHIGLGNEGRLGGSEAFWYVGDLALSLDGWIGDTI